MLRIIHTADVHLGARHDDLGEQAAAQRERQFAAFVATVDLAIAEKVDLFVVAGDLFDSNVQPRRSVERVAAQLKRLADARIRSVIAPGTHDVHDRASIYRAYDLKVLAGSTPDDDIPSLDSIREVLDRSRQDLLQTIQAFSDDDLEVIPEAFRERGWTLGTIIQVISWHECHHQGQAHLTLNLYKAAQ